MPSQLQKKLAEFGFESNDDYQFQLDCFFSAKHKNLPLLIIEGDQQRRKTAFANALAQALEYPHILYYDFSQQEAADGKVQLPEIEDENGIKAKPVSDFDYVMSEACAHSEAEQTIMILDQLHLTDFKNHIRLYHFVRNFYWEYPGMSLRANPEKFILILISKDEIYHSLQKSGFRIWVNPSHQKQHFQARDFNLDDSLNPVIESLDAVFNQLGMFPTISEYHHILHDIQFNIKNEQHLIHSIYGWTETIQLDMLQTEKIYPLLQAVIKTLHQYWQVDEELCLSINGTESADNH